MLKHYWFSKWPLFYLVRNVGHVNVIPMKVDVTNRGIVKIISKCLCNGMGLNGWSNQLWYSQNYRLVTSILRAFVDVAPARQLSNKRW